MRLPRGVCVRLQAATETETPGPTEMTLTRTVWGLGFRGLGA